MKSSAIGHQDGDGIEQPAASRSLRLGRQTGRTPSQHIGDFFRWASRYRSIRLTSLGARFLLLTLGVGGAAINTGHNLLYLFFAMMLSLVVVSGILSEQCFRLLDIRRQLPTHLFADHPSTASLVITNRKARLSSYSLRIMDVMSGSAVDRGIRLLCLPPGASVRRSYPLQVSRRGRCHLEGIKLVTRFPFGFFVKSATLSVQAEVIVYPPIRALPSTLLRDLIAIGQGASIPQRGQGTGLYNLRLFQPGDDSRTIHWKITARKTQLIVRETEAENLQRVTLALYPGVPGMKKLRKDSNTAELVFEEAVTLTASLAQFFYRRGYHIRLLIGEDELAFGIGEPHFHRLLTRLALCEPTPSPRLPGRHGFATLAAGSDCSIVVLPTADPVMADICQSATRILVASELT